MNFSAIALLCFGLFLNIGKCATRIVATSIECKSKDLSFSNFSRCDLKPVRRGVKEISVHVKLLQKPVDNVTLHAEIRRRPFSGKAIYGVRFDACAFYRNKRRNPLANALVEYLHFDALSNMNHTCPYNHDIILNRLPIDRNLKYLPVEKGEYAFWSEWIAYNKVRATVTVNFHVED